MVLSVSGPLDSIITQLGLHSPAKIYDTEVPAEDQLVYTNGVMNPYFVAQIGGPEVTPYSRGIVGVRADAMVMHFTVSCVAPDREGRNALSDAALNALTGFEPEDSSEMVPKGGLTYSNAYNDVRPSLYYKLLSFDFFSNLTI